MNLSCATFCVALVGCGLAVDTRPWHARVGWAAVDYFDDPLVIELCAAIEANDLEEIDRVVAAGADVNALGLGNMTPLLWAFPDDKIERFRRLLAHGADPNVCVTEDFGTSSLIKPGYAVTHLVIKSKFKEHYLAVFEYNGNANLPANTKDGIDYPIHILVEAFCPDKLRRLRVLLENGADLNVLGRHGETPASAAAGFLGQYGLALEILKAGADPWTYHRDELQTIGHAVIYHMRSTSVGEGGIVTPFGELVNWLNENAPGLLDTAKDDLLRWKSYTGTIAQVKAKQRREIERRKIREAEERAKQEQSAATEK